MGQRFVACDREQSFLMPPDVRDWLPESHLAWFVIDAVEEMNLDGFYAAYREDGRSRPAYDPAMMVAVLLYAYARGLRSSRVIERACVEDVAFRVLAAKQRPDHATIARFIDRHQDALAGLFGELLALPRSRSPWPSAATATCRPQRRSASAHSRAGRAEGAVGERGWPPRSTE